MYAGMRYDMEYSIFSTMCPPGTTFGTSFWPDLSVSGSISAPRWSSEVGLSFDLGFADQITQLPGQTRHY